MQPKEREHVPGGACMQAGMCAPWIWRALGATDAAEELLSKPSQLVALVMGNLAEEDARMAVRSAVTWRMGESQ